VREGGGGGVVALPWRHVSTCGDERGDEAATKKFRNVEANPQAALVVDDLASVDPWHPRAVIVEGSAEALSRGGEDDALIRITPEKIISWGLETPA